MMNTNTMLIAFAVVLLLAAGIGYVMLLPKGPAPIVVPSGQTQGATLAANGAYQEVYVTALGTGYYDKQQVTVKKGIPVRFHFTAEPSAGCGKMLLIPAFKVQLISQNSKEQVAEFTPAVEGTYPYHCSMNMFRGNLIVTS